MTRTGNVDQAEPRPTINCRLCSAVARFRFQKAVLARHNVAYYACDACGSMQTEAPYWLDAAYDIPGVHIDVGIASRTLRNWIGLALLFDAIGLDRSANIVDYGGVRVFSRGSCAITATICALMINTRHRLS